MPGQFGVETNCAVQRFGGGMTGGAEKLKPARAYLAKSSRDGLRPTGASRKIAGDRIVGKCGAHLLGRILGQFEEGCERKPFVRRMCGDRSLGGGSQAGIAEQSPDAGR